VLRPRVTFYSVDVKPFFVGGLRLPKYYQSYYNSWKKKITPGKSRGWTSQSLRFLCTSEWY